MSMATPAETPPPGAAFSIVWTCEGRELKLGGEPGEILSKPLTVGEKFLLTCSGPEAGLLKESLAIRLPTSAEHAFRMLEARAVEPTNASFVAVVYRTGELKIADAALTSEGRGVRLQGLAFKVASVIDPKTNPEMKPYPPFPPLDLAYPAWIWASFASAAAVCALTAAWAIKRRYDRKRFKKTLAAHPIAGSAYAHFNKELRQLNRRFPMDESKPWPPQAAREYAAELDRVLRWYLARALDAPVLTGGPRAAARCLRERARPVSADERGIGAPPQSSSGGLPGRAQLARTERAIVSAFSELGRALRPDSKIGMTDGQQLAALCRRAADGVERVLRAAGRAP